MKIAIVILNWNGKKLLEQFLPSVIKHSMAFADVYVADNDSNDDSIEFIKQHFPNVKIIQNTENGGYAKGYNDALQHVEADVYALVNSDIEVTQGWLKPIVTQLENDPAIAAIQPKILDFKDKTKFEYAGAAGGCIDSYGYLYCRGRIFDTIEIDKGQYDDVKDIFWASGACFFIRSEIFHKLNGFDEDFFAHQEEVDICWRIQNLGHKILYIGDSTVYHVGGATLSSANPKKTYLNFRNSLFMLVKNLPKKKLVSSLFIRLLLDGLAAFKFLLTIKPMHAFSILRAHISFYVNLSKYLEKRKKQSNRLENFYNTKSIVLNYFLKGKKYYQE